MTRTKRHTDLVIARREKVARLRLRGLTTREIAIYLAKDGIVNEAGKPFDHSVIVRDLAAIRAEWIRHATEDFETERARYLAELAEGKRLAWRDEDLRALARFLKLESVARGLNAPTRIEHGGEIDIHDWRQDAREYGVDPDAIVESLRREIMREDRDPPADQDQDQDAQPAQIAIAIAQDTTGTTDDHGNDGHDATDTES